MTVSILTKAITRNSKPMFRGKNQNHLIGRHKTSYGSKRINNQEHTVISRQHLL